MALGAIGRAEPTDHIGRAHKRCRLMTPDMIPQPQMVCLRRGGCALRQQDLTGCRVQLGSRQNKAGPGCELDGSRHLEVLARLWHGPDRGKAAYGQAAPWHWEQAHAPFLLATEAPGALCRGLWPRLDLGQGLL
jgi:hypothetical protein